MRDWAKLHADISKSRSFAAACNEDPRAGLLFLMMLPRADVLGIVDAHPVIFRGEVCPLLRLTDDELERCLAILQEQDMVVLYECPKGDRWLWVKHWAKYQEVRWTHVGATTRPLPEGWEPPDGLDDFLQEYPGKPLSIAIVKLRANYCSTTVVLQCPRERARETETETETETENNLAPPAVAEAALLEVEPEKPEKPRRKETDEQLAIRETFEQLTGIDWPGGTPKGYTGLHAEVVNRGYDILRTWAVSGDETTKPGTAKNLVGWYFTRAAEAMRRDWKYIAKNGNTPSAEHQSWQGWPSRFEVECLTGVFTDEEVSEAARSPDYWNFPTHNINGSEQQCLEKAHRKYEREKASAEAEA